MERTPEFSFRVRKAHEGDLPAILAIYNEAVLNTTASYDNEPRSLETQQAWYRLRVEAKLPVFVAEDSLGNVVGWSCLNPYNAKPGYRFTAENSIYIAADFRGRGLGKALLAPLIFAAESLGLHTIIAAIDASNPVSIHLHDRFGFVKVGHFSQVGHKFGRWLDVVYMQLILPDAKP